MSTGTALARPGSNGIAPQQDPGKAIVFTPDVVSTIRKTVAAGIKTDAAFAVFIAFAERSGLDPLRRELYGWTDNTGKLVMVTGIDGFRRLGGQRAQVVGIEYEYCGPDAVFRSVWVDEKTPPLACRCRMWVKGSARPFESVIYYSEFCVPSNPNWKQRPRHMLAIRAEAHTWRKIPAARLGDLELLDEGQTIPGTSRVVEEPQPQLAEPAPLRFEPVEPEASAASAREAASAPRTPTTPATNTRPQKQQSPRERAFAAYRSAGGNPSDAELFVVHLAQALDDSTIERLQHVTPRQWEDAAAQFEEKRCLPGSEGWPLTPAVEDPFNEDDPGATSGTLGLEE